MSEENNNMNSEAEVTEKVTPVIEEKNVAEEGIFTFNPENAAASSEKKPFPTAIVAIAAAVVVIAAIVVVLIMNWSTWFNKYNRMGYVDVSGRTVAEVADASGMELSEFLEEFGLPEDMPANTTESAAYYMIPCSRIAATYGMDFNTLKETLKWDDSITEDTTWGEAEGETTLGVYVGEEGLEEFKEFYGLDSSVNADTKWKEVRTAVDTKNKEENEKAKQQAESETDEVVTEDEAATEEDTAATENTAEEVPAE